MKKLFVVVHLLSALVLSKAALAGPGDSCHFHGSKTASEPVVIKCADHIIDLGPEGGRGGGQIVATGTPEEVAKNKKSITGLFLKEELK